MSQATISSMFARWRHYNKALREAVVDLTEEQLAARPTPALESELAGLLDAKLARKVVRNLDDHQRLAARDARNVSELRERLGRRPMIEVPELAGDVHDLAGLAAVNRYLFAA
jgi:hypothetical protein